MKKNKTERPLQLVWIEPDGAALNPDNWRLHDVLQTQALEDLIFDREADSYVGWAGTALINDRHEEDGWSADEAHPTFVDGHARQKVAAQRGEPMPALVGRWTPAQEATILLTLDPLAGLATTDEGALNLVHFQIKTDRPAVREILGFSNQSTATKERELMTPPKFTRLFKFGPWEIPLTIEEEQRLSDLAFAYVETYGVAHGFMRNLLKL